MDTVLSSKIEMRHLKMIKTIAETENLTKAAQKLCVTQPALSQQLKDIEEKLETDIFFRTRKKMILTEIGKKLLQTANSVLEEIRLTELEVSKAVHGETGELKIGVHCLLSYKWLPAVVQKYQELFPKVEIEISNCHTIIKELKSDRFDLVVTAVPVDHKYIDYYSLFEDDIVLISAPGHPISSKKFVTEKDFEEETLISLIDKSKDALYQYYLLPAGIKLKKFLTIDQPAAIVELVKSNIGIALFPKWSVEAQLKAGEINACTISRDGVKLEWKAVYFKEKKFPAHQQAFIKLLKSLPLPRTL